jgi:Rhs element Vgr protein
MSDNRRTPAEASVDRPTYTIKIDGTEVSETYQIASISVRHAVNKVSMAVIQVLDGSPADEDFPASNAEDWVPGKAVDIDLGYKRVEETVFKGVIIAQKIKLRSGKPSMLTITCKDEAVKLTVGRKNRYFYELTDSDAIEELANEAGLSTDVAATNGTHQSLVQYHSTDWDFLVARAEVNGQFVLTEDGTLRTASPDLSQSPALSLLFGGNILGMDLEMDARYQFKAVTAASWDPANQETIVAEAAAPSGSFPGNIDAEELAEVIGLDQYELRHPGQLKDTELQAWADMQLLKSRLSKIRGRLKIQGVNTLRPGQMIELNGAGDRFNGKHFVAGVQHDLMVGSFVTHLELGVDADWFNQQYPDIAASKAQGVLPPSNGLHIGLVTALEGDPEGEGRIQIRVPAINAEEEGIWTRVAAFDAGEERGAFFMPEIGDEVVLGFLDDDPRHAVMLGMLHSSAKPAFLEPTDDNHEKGLQTRSGIKLLFNDDTAVVTLETPNGNQLILSDDEGACTLADENGNKIVLNSDGITIESAKDIQLKASGDLKAEGVNVELAAQAQMKTSGSSGAELSSSGSTVVKGSVVQIN